MSKASRMLERVQEYIGGDLKISRRGVPYLLLKGGYSVCCFCSGRFLRTFLGFGTPDNRKYRDFKQFPELVRHFHFDLGYAWVGDWYLEKLKDE